MAVVYKISDNIISSLGFTTEENMIAVLGGKSGLKPYPENFMGVPEAFFASIVDTDILEEKFSEISDETHFTRFEKLGILSIHNAIQNNEIDISSKRTLFILSTTKGNVGLLENQKDEYFEEDKLLLNYSASTISRFFGNTNNPIVVSNACISGVSAQIVAKRMLNTGKYDFAVVVGVDVISKFIITGFQSFKALSLENCKPFDANRIGLNLGEGAATVILGITDSEANLPKDSIVLEAGAISNDANHISGPSRTGEGLFLALQTILKDRKVEEIGFVNAHGTATPFNDEMESMALSRVNFDAIPVNSLKGYFGHTLGAAGLLESIVSAHSLVQNKLIKSYGYETCGVSNPLNIITKTESKDITRCIKMVSGFGGCNAALMLKKIK